jgi:hypothetical protein
MPVVAQRFEQLALRAARSVRAPAPPSPARSRTSARERRATRAFARQLGQRARDHFAIGVVVVLRGELEQLESRASITGSASSTSSSGLSFSAAARSSRPASAPRRPALASERHAHARPGRGACLVARAAGNRTVGAAAYRARRARSDRVKTAPQGFPQCVWISLWMASDGDYKNAVFLQFLVRLIES